mmetsp:Transcript_10506/g.16080  ORF Transcript_10506/g.16080 Transcript_10506/m.16080 type:complete len:146 (-) Transcript_10506:3575-4012(-)
MRKRMSHVSHSQKLIEKSAASSQQPKSKNKLELCLVNENEGSDIKDSEIASSPHKKSSAKCIMGKKYIFAHDFPWRHPHVKEQRSFRHVYSLISSIKHVRKHVCLEDKKMGKLMDELLHDVNSKQQSPTQCQSEPSLVQKKEYLN